VELDAIMLSASGAFTVQGDGVSAGRRSGGTWSAIVRNGLVVLFPSIGYPTAPDPITVLRAPV
jgi:hypothetical protein